MEVCADWKLTVTKAVHPAKAALPMVFAFGAMVTSVSAVHPAKVESAMEVSPLKERSSVKLVISVSPLKTSPKSVTACASR